MAQPLTRKKKEVKKRKHFDRHQCDRKACVKPSWRRPKGIDGRVRRKFKGMIKMPNCGYGSDKKTRHVLPNGLLKFVVHNARELDLLMMHNRRYCGEVAASVGAKQRKAIVERARELNVALTNKHARLRENEDE